MRLLAHRYFSTRGCLSAHQPDILLRHMLNEMATVEGTKFIQCSIRGFFLSKMQEVIALKIFKNIFLSNILNITSRSTGSSLLFVIGLRHYNVRVKNIHHFQPEDRLYNELHSGGGSNPPRIGSVEIWGRWGQRDPNYHAAARVFWPPEHFHTLFFFYLFLFNIISSLNF